MANRGGTGGLLIIGGRNVIRSWLARGRLGFWVHFVQYVVTDIECHLLNRLQKGLLHRPERSLILQQQLLSA